MKTRILTSIFLLMPLVYSNAITKADIETHEPSNDIFNAKWNTVTALPITEMRSYAFFRSFPRFFHADPKITTMYNGLGNEWKPISYNSNFCLGDPHPKNFGFVRYSPISTGDVTSNYQTKWLYTYNDFDDSGKCFFLQDSLKYFTSLYLLHAYPRKEGNNIITVNSFIDLYGTYIKAYMSGSADKPSVAKEFALLATSKYPGKSPRISKELNFAKAGEKLIEDEIVTEDGTQFSSNFTVSDIETGAKIDSASLVQSLKNVLSTSNGFNHAPTISSVAKITRTAGGSGALSRYWFLAHYNNTPYVIEMKEILTDNTYSGGNMTTNMLAAIDKHSTSPMALDNRYATLINQLWNIDSSHQFPIAASSSSCSSSVDCPTAKTNKFYDYNTIYYDNKYFVIRNRALLAHFNIDKLDPISLDNQIKAQISYLVRFQMHNNYFAGKTNAQIDSLMNWLKANSLALANDWINISNTGSAAAGNSTPAETNVTGGTAPLETLWGNRVTLQMTLDLAT